MKLLIWNPNDPSEGERSDLQPDGRRLKLLRRVLGLRDPLPDAPHGPSIVERLDEIFAHDRTRLNEVLPRDIGITSSPGLGRIEAPVPAELDSPTEDHSSTGPSPRSEAEVGQALQTAPAEANEGSSMPPEATAVHSINLAAREATAQLQATYERLEASLKSFAEDYEKRQAELFSAFERVSGTSKGVPQKITKKLVDELEKAAQDVWNRSAKQLQQQADAGAAALNELRASRQGLIDETKKELASLARVSLEPLAKATIDEGRSQLEQASQEQVRATRLDAEAAVDSIHRAATEAVAKFERTQQEMEESLKRSAEDCQKRLAELRSAMEESERQSDAQRRGQSETLREGFRQEASKEVAEELERVSQEILNRSAKQLQEQAETTQAVLGEQLGAAKQTFIEAMRKQLVTMTQTSRESLFKETTEMSRSQLSRMLQESLAKGVQELEAQQRELLKKQSQVIQKQFNALSETYLGEYRSELARLGPSTTRRVGSLSAGLNVGLGVLIATTALIVVGIYASRPAEMRLRAEPPARFFEERPDWNAKRRAREEQLARAYWERAVRDVQVKYKFGTNLPDEPPAEFRVEEKGLSGSNTKVDPVARARYWGKLRQVWLLPEAWEKSYGWNTDWIRSALQSAYSKSKKKIGLYVS